MYDLPRVDLGWEWLRDVSKLSETTLHVGGKNWMTQMSMSNTVWPDLGKISSFRIIFWIPNLPKGLKVLYLKYFWIVISIKLLLNNLIFLATFWSLIGWCKPLARARSALARFVASYLLSTHHDESERNYVAYREEWKLLVGVPRWLDFSPFGRLI
jgi:hypothetical protein